MNNNQKDFIGYIIVKMNKLNATHVRLARTFSKKVINSYSAGWILFSFFDSDQEYLVHLKSNGLNEYYQSGGKEILKSVDVLRKMEEEIK